MSSPSHPRATRARSGGVPPPDEAKPRPYAKAARKPVCAWMRESPSATDGAKARECRALALLASGGETPPLRAVHGRGTPVPRNPTDESPAPPEPSVPYEPHGLTFTSVNKVELKTEVTRCARS
ncbi:MAG: hypothetical protein LBI02_03300 [Opitutaceae bacterium]|nr:hypothetical protein [Opitutaceae bacterium]